MKPVYETYLKEVGKLLPNSGAERKEYIQRLKISVTDYASEHENCTLEDLYRVFGAPDEIADSYLEGTDPKQVSGHILKRKLLICLLSVIILIGVVVGIIEYHRYNTIKSVEEGYDVEIIEELPSEADTTPIPIEVH